MLKELTHTTMKKTTVNTCSNCDHHNRMVGIYQQLIWTKEEIIKSLKEQYEIISIDKIKIEKIYLN